MRLKSAVWVSAYIRACTARAVPAVVVRRGEASAGAIFIKINRLDGTVRLLAPAPQALALDDDADRRWSEAGDGAAMAEDKADAIIEKEMRFDPDLWLIEVEDRAGRDFLEDRLV